MVKISKLKTPEWILKGHDSEEDYLEAKSKSNKKITGKTFKIRKCSSCGSYNVGVVLGGEEGKGGKGWECHNCKWCGTDIKEEVLSENEFMKYLDDKGEDVS